MTQFTINGDNVYARLIYRLETEDEGTIDVDWDVGSFEDLNYYLEATYKKDESKVLDGISKGVTNWEFIGIELRGREPGKNGESIVVTKMEGYSSATAMFEGSKYGDRNEDKLKRIQSIINEKYSKD